MAHYAFLNENNIVTEVITGVDENDLDNLPDEFSSWEEFYSNFRNQTCKRTSYNTFNNEHLLGGIPFRGNYAAKDFIYDAVNDVFIPPKPYESFSLDETTWTWKAPVDYPNDGNEYYWNENQQNWELISS